MAAGYRKLLQKDITPSQISKWLDNHDKEIKYSYTSIKNSDTLEKELDTIVIKVRDIRHEVEDNVNYSKLTGNENNLNKRFVRAYVLRFLQIFLCELAKGNTVVIGNREIGFSFNTVFKKRAFKGTLKEYPTLRVYVHISEKLFKKTKVFYYAHVDKKFSRAFKDVRKNIKYLRYPLNFLEK